MNIDLRKENISLTEAVFKAQPHDVIYLADKTYREKIYVKTPHLTWIGSKHTKITFSAFSGDIIPASLGGDGSKTYGTTGSATVTILPSAVGFKAKGIIFENGYVRNGEEQSQAVAFKSETSDIEIIDCSFISHQDTLYIDFGTNNVIQNCRITGDIDFIFGTAECAFIDCIIHARGDEKNCCYYTAPATYKRHKQGFLFENCRFTKDDEIKELYLGRPWFPSKAVEPVHPRIYFRNCEFPKDTYLYLKKMHREDPSEYVFSLEDCKIGR